MLLEQSDSLLLSPAQVMALRDAGDAYAGRADSVWAGLADYLAGLGDRFDTHEALDRVEAATDQVWEMQ